MAEDHQAVTPVVLEQLVSGLTELEVVLGEVGKQVVPAIRTRLIEAMAARDRGDSQTMVRAVGAAMRELAAVGDRVGQGEGRMMTALAERFERSLLQGDLANAKKDMDVMFDRSGARIQNDEE
jgi:hypothetical protein